MAVEVLNNENIVNLEDIYIERLILKNFISYQNEEIIFKRGFNIIWGETGTGKSSIYDALKFILGSKEKDKGNKWEENIKKGEKFSSVEIHIVRNNQIYKLKRSIRLGRSTIYEIQLPQENKFHKTKLKKYLEIVSLFKIDPDNPFTFVAQGNITEIKDLNPRKLSECIELGLGLVELKNKILESKKNAEYFQKEIQGLDVQKSNALENLDEINKKVERLKEKKKLLNQKDILETEKLWYNKNELINEYNKKKKELENKKSELIIKETDKANILNNIKNINIEIENKEIEKNKIHDDINSLQSEIAVIKNDIIKNREELDQISREIPRLKSWIKSSSGELNENQNKKKNIEQKITSYKKELEEIIEKKTKLINQFDENEKIYQKYEKINNKYQQLEVQRQSIKKNLESIESEIKNIENQIYNKILEIDQNKKELEKYKSYTIDLNKYPLNELIEKQKKFNSAIQKLEAEEKLLREEISNIENQIENIKNEIANKGFKKSKELINLMQAIRTQGINTIGPIIDYIEFDAKLTSAIFSIFNKYELSSFIALDKASFLKLENLIKKYKVKCNVYQTLPGDISPLPPISFSKSDGVYGYIYNFIKPLVPNEELKKFLLYKCKNTILVKNIAVGYDLIYNSKYKGNIVTIGGDLIKKEKYIVELRCSYFIKTTYDINEFYKKETEFNSLLNQKREVLKRLLAQKDKLKNTLNKIERTISCSNQIQNLYHKRNILINEKNEILRKKENFIKNRETFINQLKTIESELDNLKDKLPKGIDWNNINNFRLQFTNNIKDIDNKIKEKNEVISKNEIDLKNIEFQIEKLNEQLDKDKERLNELNKKMDSYDSTIKANINKKADLEYRINDLNTLILKIQEEKVELQNKANLLNEEISKINIVIGRLETKIEKIQDDLSNLEQKINDIKINIEILGNNYIPRPLEEIENEYKLVLEKLREYYDISEEIINKKHELEDNISKIDEKRKQTLQELNECIFSLNKFKSEYSIKFDNGLRFVENYINNIFKIMNISRTVRIEKRGDVEDSLIYFYINVHNIGELEISSLSGGEKSILQLSVILSLQEKNPTPFCIFDECQMFMDLKKSIETNKLIKHITKKGIQVVILTPDQTKIAPEYADSIIGVFKENNVSRIVNFPIENFLNKLKN